MNLRLEYEIIEGRFIPQEEILTDEEDSFSWWFYDPDGKLGIASIHRNTEIFWRNRPDYVEPESVE